LRFRVVLGKRDLWQFLWHFVAGGFSEDDMAKSVSFRIGKVKGYLRNAVWYLCYQEEGVRRRPRVGGDRDAAKQMASQINGQLETGAPSALSYTPIAIPALRDHWLAHHEQVLRSSVQSIQRYRTATDHLLRFLTTRPVRHAAIFQTAHAEEFVSYLRSIRVSPNGHANTVKRPLMDKGIRYILETCHALFNYAAKRRHLTPYSENPFAVLDIDRMPVETSRAIVLMTAAQERQFLEACDDWQFPLFATLMFTGLRPGEACHLLVTDDLDLDEGILRVRNKPKLGWQVKTRNQRDIPLIPELVSVLRQHLAGRTTGPVFTRRTWKTDRMAFDASAVASIERELVRRIGVAETSAKEPLSRVGRQGVAREVWRDLGAVKEDLVRIQFMRLTKKLGWPEQTAPKVFRHQFATMLQEGRVDPLVRNLLMGHATDNARSAGHGLGMTAVYTHTRPETIREQLLMALRDRPARQYLIERRNAIRSQ
jgi:integrase